MVDYHSVGVVVALLVILTERGVRGIDKLLPIEEGEKKKKKNL